MCGLEVTVLVTVYFNIIAYKQCVLTYRRSIKLMLKYKGHWISMLYCMIDTVFYSIGIIVLHCIVYYVVLLYIYRMCYP